MLKQKFVIQFGSNIFLRVVGLISGIFVARIAGAEVVGTLAFATAYVSVFGFIFGLFGTSHIKLISENKNLGDCIATYTRLQSSSILIYFIVVILFFCIQKFIFNYTFESRDHEIIIMITLLTTVFTKFVQFNDSSFTAQLKQVKANLPNIIRGLLFQLGKIIVVLLGYKALGIANWGLFCAALTIPIAYKLYKSFPRGSFNKNLYRNYVKISIPIFLVVILNSLLTFSDKIILQHFTNSAELGYYAVAYSLGGIILILGNTMGVVFFPLFSKLIKDGGWSEINKKIFNYQKIVTCFIFPIILLIVIISKPLILTILGDGFENSVMPFRLLILSSYLTILMIPYGNILSGLGLFYLNFWLKLVKFIFYIIFLILFISPSFFDLGAIGLALNLLIANIIHSALVYFFALKKGEIKMNLLALKRYFFITLFGTITYIFYYYFGMDKDYFWVLFISISLVANYLFLSYFKLINANDLDNIKKIISPKRSFLYIKKEINE